LAALAGCVYGPPPGPAYGYGYSYPPSYYAYAPPAYYYGPPVGLNFGFVFGEGHHHWR